MPKPLTRIEESILLALVGKELYGVEIAIAIHQSSGDCIYGQSNLCVAFDRLEKKGFISSRLAESHERLEEKGGARRKYYALTDEGADELDKLDRLKSNLMKWQPNKNNVTAVKSRILK